VHESKLCVADAEGAEDDDGDRATGRCRASGGKGREAEGRRVDEGSASLPA